MFSIEELKNRRCVDPDQIDLEISQQPEFFDDVSELAADQRAEAKAAKANFEAKKASIALKYRSGEITTDVKLTDSSVIALVDSHKEVIECRRILIDEEREASKLDGLVGAFEQKRSMIKYSAELMMNNLFQMAEVRPRVSKSANQDVEQEIIRRRQTNERRTSNS